MPLYRQRFAIKLCIGGASLPQKITNSRTMENQGILETQQETNSKDRFIVEKKNSIKSGNKPPRLSDAFMNIVTREEVKDLVRKAIAPDIELVQYHLRHYSAEKMGFLGSHLCLVVQARSPGSSVCEKRSFFVKTLPFDVPSQAEYIKEKKCFLKETEFFKKLVPILMENFKGESWSPKCYIAKEHTLVFEDMKYKGFANSQRFFNEKTMRSAVACIARFHACSLLAEEHLNGKSLYDLHSELLQESEFTRTGRSYTWYEKAIDLAVSLADDMGLDSSSIRRASERVFDMTVPSKTKRNVISHGDLWSSNLLFDGAGRCNLVDFQLTRYSPLAHDLTQLLYLAGSSELRRSHEREMIEHYYSTLKAALLLNGYTGVVPHFEEVLQGVEEQRLPALVTAVIFHPTVLMDGKVAAEIMNDPITYEAYYFGERKPFVLRIMAKDNEYEKSIKGCVRELVKMSLGLDSVPRPS